MKSILFIITTLLTLQLHAEDIRCLSTDLAIEGQNLYLTLYIDLEESTVSNLELELLAENGFYSKFPATISHSEFVSQSSLEVTFTDGSETIKTLSVVYNPEKQNYQGQITVDATSEDQGVHETTFTCMLLKGF